MLYERQADWLMFVWIGSGYDLFQSMKAKYSESRTWTGTLMYVNGECKAETWHREKIYVQ